MWVEALENGKYKYFERYRDPLTEKLKKVSITLDKNTSRAQKEAQRLLQEKIDKHVKDADVSNITFWELNYMKSISRTGPQQLKILQSVV